MKDKLLHKIFKPAISNFLKNFKDTIIDLVMAIFRYQQPKEKIEPVNNYNF